MTVPAAAAARLRRRLRAACAALWRWMRPRVVAPPHHGHVDPRVAGVLGGGVLGGGIPFVAVPPAARAGLTWRHVVADHDHDHDGGGGGDWCLFVDGPDAERALVGTALWHALHPDAPPGRATVRRYPDVYGVVRRRLRFPDAAGNAPAHCLATVVRVVGAQRMAACLRLALRALLSDTVAPALPRGVLVAVVFAHHRRPHRGTFELSLVA